MFVVCVCVCVCVCVSMYVAVLRNIITLVWFDPSEWPKMTREDVGEKNMF